MEYTIDLTKIARTCKTCLMGGPNATQCSQTHDRYRECLFGAKRIHWTPDPFVLMELAFKKESVNSEKITAKQLCNYSSKMIYFLVGHNLDLIPRKIASTMYGRLSTTREYAQRHNKLVIATTHRESGWYPYMREEQKSEYCLANCKSITKWKSPEGYYNFCPFCGRKLK